MGVPAATNVLDMGTNVCVCVPVWVQASGCFSAYVWH